MSGCIFVICFIATDEVKHQTPESSCLAVGQKSNIFEKIWNQTTILTSFWKCSCFPKSIAILKCNVFIIVLWNVLILNILNHSQIQFLKRWRSVVITYPEKRPFANTIIFVSSILRTRCLGLFFIVCVIADSLMLSSVQSFSLSDSLRPHGLQHARLPCPSAHPGACSNSCPSSQWYHSTISSSVISFSSYPQSFPALGSFPVSPALHIRRPKFSFSISPSIEYSGLISFRID